MRDFINIFHLNLLQHKGRAIVWHKKSNWEKYWDYVCMFCREKEILEKKNFPFECGKIIFRFLIFRFITCSHGFRYLNTRNNFLLYKTLTIKPPKENQRIRRQTYLHRLRIDKGNLFYLALFMYMLCLCNKIK